MTPSDLLYALQHFSTLTSRKRFYNYCHKRDSQRSINRDARSLSRQFTRQVIRTLAANGIWNEGIENELRRRLQQLALSESLESLIASPSIPAPPAEPDLSAFFPPGDLPAPKTTSELLSLLSKTEQETLAILQTSLARHRAIGLRALPEHVSPAAYLRLLRTRDTGNEALVVNYWRYLHSCERFERWLRLKLTQLRAGRIVLEQVNVDANLFFHVRECSSPDAERNSSDGSALDPLAANNALLIGVRDSSVRSFERHRALNAARFGQPLVFNFELAANLCTKETHSLARALASCISANEALPEPMHLVFAGLRPDMPLARRLAALLNTPIGAVLRESLF